MHGVGVDSLFIYWCAEQVGAGERVVSAADIAEWIGCDVGLIVKFLEDTVANGGLIDVYSVARAGSLWRVFYVFQDARGAFNLSIPLSSRDRGRPAPSSQQQMVGDVG